MPNVLTQDVAGFHAPDFLCFAVTRRGPYRARLACLHLCLFTANTKNPPAIATISCPMPGVVYDSSALKYGKNAKYLTGAVETPVAFT